VLQAIHRVLKNLTGKNVRAEVCADGQRFIVRSRGMNEYRLPEVEISECPSNMTEVGSNLVLQIASNTRDAPESLQAGKAVGARFVRSDQQLIEAFRFVQASTDSKNLRIADLEEGRGKFPHRLFATHLCATAGVHPNEALRLLLVAIEVWPREPVASNAALGDYEYNPNNFWSWIDLGTVLSKAGRVEDAISHWKIGVCMWPRGGKFYSARMLAKESQSAWDAANKDVIDEFWRSVTNDSISGWCRTLAVTLPEAALAD
jgi:hypothetical protein